jgi:serine/threonine-protein kinase
VNRLLDIDAGSWAKLRELLDVGLSLPAPECEQWLAQLPQEYVALEPRLRALLRHRQETTTESPLCTLPRLELSEVENNSVGPYRLVRQLGEGGMGSVWLAERLDGLVKRPVALKLPRIFGDPNALRERMARERAFLAALDHPNIARLYDVGMTPEGKPYLALEYVDGERIDIYCRERGLWVRDRLKLFLQVASAVAHAHAKLIVHRDLKPANILVSADGQVRLLDFGVAKLLSDSDTADSALTQWAGRALTPDYASPEQVARQPIGIGSDVYSLGVVLYELLTGQRPYKLARDSAAALEEAILAVEPLKPSATAIEPAVRRVLRGDLDTIVLKALKKRPEQRYATVNALVDDIERYLGRRPIQARPDSSWYRAQMFFLRNRFWVSLTAVFALAIMVGAIAAIWQAREANLERDVALRATRVAKASVGLTDFLTADLSTGRSTTQLEQEIERAIEAVRAQYADDPLVRVRLLAGLAGRLRQLGSFERHRSLVGELEPLAKAIGDVQSAAVFSCWRARDMSASDQLVFAQPLVSRALADLRRIKPPPVENISSCLGDQSAIARAIGDSAGALRSIEEALQIETDAGQARTDMHANTLFLLSRAYAQNGRYRQSVQAARESIDLREAIGQADTPGMINAKEALAVALRQGGQPLPALQIYDELLAQHENRRGSTASVATLEQGRAMTLLRCGLWSDALPVLKVAFDGAVAKGDLVVMRETRVARVMAYADQGDFAQADTILKEAAQAYAPLRAKRAFASRVYLSAQAQLGLAERKADMADAALREMRIILQQLHNEQDPAWRFYYSFSAKLDLLRNDYSAALRDSESALALGRAQAIDQRVSSWVGEDLLTRAEAQWGLGHPDTARADAREAARQLQAAAGPKHPALGRAVELSNAAG